jgi:uncharacterized protein (TIGR00369 family)
MLLMNPNNHTPEPDFEERICTSFERQQVLQLLDARLAKVLPGEVHIEFPYHPKITQQHGYIHAGIISTVVDSACGYAAYSLMAPHASVLSIEFKVNFLHPARGEYFVGVGKVIKSGRTLTVCSGELLAFNQGQSQLVAVMQATMIAVARKG